MVAILGAAQRQFKGRLPMNSARNWVGGMLVAALCLPTVRAVGDPSEADKAVLCAAQSEGPGGLPVTLAQWAEGARLSGDWAPSTAPISTHSPEAQTYFDQGMRFLW